MHEISNSRTLYISRLVLCFRSRLDDGIFIDKVQVRNEYGAAVETFLLDFNNTGAFA